MTEAEAPHPAGVAFPAAEDGARSTTAAGAAIVAAALAALHGPAAQAALGERHWRRNYPQHFRQLVASALPDGERALASARAGLAAAHTTLVWEGGLGARRPLQDAMATPRGEPLGTFELRGQGSAAPAPWGLPLKGQLLQGQALVDQVYSWSEAGVIEPSAARALARCAANPAWFDLSDRHIALLGAGSEAGPLRWLCRWRAQMLAVDINRPGAWQRIADTVQQGNATVRLPLHTPNVAQGALDWSELAGADLLSDAPRIAQWLASFDRPLDIASLAYLDGEKHVRVSLAMDLVVTHVLAAQPSSSLAYLATPTDVFAVPESAVQASMQRYTERPMFSRSLQSPLHLATGDRFFQPNYERLFDGPDGRRFGLSDSLVLEQGPNYALAKRLQQWRALVARAEGHRVSLNVAPSTTTASVVKNPALAAGFAGAATFGIEVFEPETTNAMMAALWVHDLRTNESAANPQVALNHPFELFIDQACHGGLWRTGYLPRSALPFAAALGWVRQRMGRA